MGKVRLELGAELNIVDEDQLRGVMHGMFASWRAETLRGGRYPRFRAQGTVTADGTLSIVPGIDNRLGPDPSMAWSVKGISVTGLTAGQAIDMTINGNTPVRSFGFPAAGTISSEKFGSNELVLSSDDHLEFTGASLTTAQVIVVNGRYHEVPIELLSRI